MFTIDTNILIYYAAGDTEIADFILQNIERGNTLFLSTITVIEFLAYPVLTQRDRLTFENVAQHLQIVALTFEISLLAAELRRKHNLKLGDATIGATAIYTHSALVTRNIRDFRKIPTLSLQKI